MIDAQAVFHNAGPFSSGGVAGVPSVPDFNYSQMDSHNFNQMGNQMPLQTAMPSYSEYPQQQIYNEQQYHAQQDPAGANVKKRRIRPDEFAGQQYEEEDEFDGDGVGDLPLVDSGVDQFKPTKLLKIKDAIEEMARKGRALSYDPSNNTYTVLDGKFFEEEFNALRATRNKKNDAAKDRPFSRMHRFYTLLQGEKWAGTGSIFTPKEGVPTNSIANQIGARSASNPSPSVSDHSHHNSTPVMGMPVPNSPEAHTPSTDVRSPDEGGGITSAENVTVSIVGLNGLERISLQHFLDVTGAGQMYAKAISLQSGGVQEQPASMGTLGQGEHSFGFDYTPQQLQAPLEMNDIYKVVGGVWTADSKGDQGYFFKRRADQRPMPNGAIVGIMQGQVVADDVYFAHRNEEDDEDEEVEMQRGLWMVVSDNNVKWKGEPIPTPEEEAEGHWCCFLGQVPVFVDGVVRTGDHIGPKCDGSGMGVVVRPGQDQPVIGIALADKYQKTPGVLKTLCFAGLNALSEGTKSPHLAALFDRMEETEKRVAALEDKVRGVQGNVEDIEMGVVGTRGDVETLAERVSLIERLQFWRRPATKGGDEEAPVTSARVAVGIPLNGAAQPMQDNSIKGRMKRHPIMLGILVGLVVALALTLGLVFALKQPAPDTHVVDSNGTVIVIASSSGSDSETD